MGDSGADVHADASSVTASGSAEEAAAAGMAAAPEGGKDSNSSQPAAGVTVQDFVLPGDAVRADDVASISSDDSDFTYYSHSEDEKDFLPQETDARPEEQRACIFEDRLER
jgi:hypothetical protein|eukprot:COSAG01_NODE_299_length_19246_cov_62.028827_10_plen_111_part_00